MKNIHIYTYTYKEFIHNEGHIHIYKDYIHNEEYIYIYIHIYIHIQRIST